MDNLNLSDVLRIRPWYLVHISEAMYAYIANSLLTEGSPALAQCREILQKAKAQMAEQQ